MCVALTCARSPRVYCSTRWEQNKPRHLALNAAVNPLPSPLSAVSYARYLQLRFLDELFSSNVKPAGDLTPSLLTVHGLKQLETEDAEESHTEDACSAIISPN